MGRFAYNLQGSKYLSFLVKTVELRYTSLYSVHDYNVQLCTVRRRGGSSAGYLR